MAIAQPDGRSSTRLTVRLTPSTATEPLTARKRASDDGASISSAHDSPSGSNRVTRPTPSTWPATRWPSRRASARIAFSRLTSALAASRPAVLSRLSAEISTWKRRASGSSRTTVMQAPDRAMLSPRPTSSRKPGGASIASTLPKPAPAPSGRASTMRPTPLTMPVNMRRLSPPGRYGGVAKASAAKPEAQVVAGPGEVDDAEIEALLQPLERPERGQAAAGAEQARREVDEQLVDQALLQQRGVELLAGFDVQLVDAASSKVGQHRGEIDLAGGRGQERDLDAARFELAPLRCVVEGRIEQHRARRREDAGRRGR